MDGQTRCIHYNGTHDVVAIRLACCGRWFPCHACHDAVTDHAIEPWPIGARAERAVLCGACGSTHSFGTYVRAADACPGCGAAWNPGCRTHWPLYFGLGPDR